MYLKSCKTESLDSAFTWKNMSLKNIDFVILLLAQLGEKKILSFYKSL